MSAPWGLLLINLGTPDAPRTREVRRFLREFLSDPRVIDLPAWRRWLLLNLIILPFRSPRSAHAYQQIWTAEGSPLRVHGEALARALRERLGVPVALGMRYGSPSLEAALAELDAAGVTRVVTLPLFPQYAASSYGSAAAELYRAAGARERVPALSVVPPFYDHPAFVEALAAVSGPALAEAAPERVLISFHGIPERHVRQADPTGARCLASASCCDAIGPHNRACYRAQCFATARALAAALGLEPARWELTFQSRLGREPWLAPYTDERVTALAREGVRRLAIVPASFAADCLETLEELGLRAKEAFLAAGGEALVVTPCLNADPRWVEGALRLVREQGEG